MALSKQTHEALGPWLRPPGGGPYAPAERGAAQARGGRGVNESGRGGRMGGGPEPQQRVVYIYIYIILIYIAYVARELKHMTRRL